MNLEELKALVNELGLKTTLALLAAVCILKADETEATIGDLEGKAIDWRADGRVLRETIPRIRN